MNFWSALWQKIKSAFKFQAPAWDSNGYIHPYYTPEKPLPQMNAAGIALVKSFEACKLTAYRDGGGIWTIGRGHTKGAKQGMTCTQAQADQWFDEDIQETVRVLQGVVPPTINENQFSACVSLAYNIGVGHFSNSTLLKKLRGGDLAGASEQFLVWDKINGVPSDGLLKRRQAEQKLFNEPVRIKDE
jgi:lysozyme